MNATAATPRVAGYTHAAGWLAGIAIAWGATPELGDSHTEIATAYADHSAQAIAQAVLVHGLAPAGLAVVAAGLLGRARRAGNRTARIAGWSGLAAAALAAVQLVLELIAISGADSAAPGTTAALWETVQRVDGLKMFALAALAVAACLAARGRQLLRRWEVVVGWTLAAAITLSGIGYLLLSTALAPAAYLSLPLLLVWVVVLGRRQDIAS
ncbi:hypothetical protein G5C51_01935 [Streptomyces sp. A7024]|uniref:DUF4386 domain-containing protein n=1 Tax=Streptomyces coryli TaxID=1128680 RepID=A0A6G4TS37_9ACTN|nr:hypothetical protein [Streptomyces coryli]NGN62664.1 hypothetical protein [Streptomyces coryli]